MKKTLKLVYLPISKASWMSDTIKNCAAKTFESLKTLPDEILYDGIVTTEQEALERARKMKEAMADAVILHFVSFPIGAAVPAAVQDLDVPVVILANPEEPSPDRVWLQNSFCGANMAAFDMNRLGRKYTFAMTEPEETAKNIAPALSAVRMLRGIVKTRIGLVGGRVPGFYTSDFDEMLLRRKFGVTVEALDLVEIIKTAETVSGEKLEAARKTVAANAAQKCKVSDHDLELAAKMLAAFRIAAEKYELDTFAVRCWPEFSDLFGIAPCAVLGMLSNEGLFTSCEGDVNGAVTMRLLEAGAGSGIPFFMDLIKFDYKTDIACVWHCGATPSGLCRNFEETTFCRHMRVDGGDKKGLTNEFSLKSGPVTLAKLDTDADGKLRMLIAPGNGVDTEPFLRGNPLNIKFDGSVKTLIDTVMKKGFEHHYALIHANVKDALVQFCEWMNIEPVVID